MRNVNGMKLPFMPVDGKPWIVNIRGSRWKITAWHGEGDAWVIDEAELVTDD